jgi:hypothetical protein
MKTGFMNYSRTPCSISILHLHVLVHCLHLNNTASVFETGHPVKFQYSRLFKPLKPSGNYKTTFNDRFSIIIDMSIRQRNLHINMS